MGKSIHTCCVASHLCVEGVVAGKQTGELILQVLIEINARISVVDKRLGVLKHVFVGLSAALALALGNVAIGNVTDCPYGRRVGLCFFIEGDA